MIKELAYAKVNLALEVMNEVDGYHLVNNLMVPIDLYDEILIEEANEFIFSSNYNIKDNICIKAYDLFMKKTEINKPVKITLVKNIPTEAGLAGGSTDAAAVLKGLNKFFNYPLSNLDLEALGGALGSDVPFFINPGLSLCTNRGEIINHLDVSFKNIPIYIVKPKIGLSTKLVYQNYKYDGISKKNNIDNIILALKNNDLELLKNNIFNDLAKVALALSPDLAKLYNELNMKYDTYISGSGPSMFVFTTDKLELEDVFVKKCRIIGDIK